MWNPLQAIKDWLKTNPSKEEAAKSLEQAHKLQFLYLVDATNFYFNLLDAGKKKSVLDNYLKKVIPISQKWSNRQLELEKAGAGVYRPIFFNRASREAINTKAAQIRGGLSGENHLGFVPLIVWGLVVAGAWAIERIVDNLTLSAAEQKDLMAATAQTCKDLNLSPADCSALLNKNLDAAKTGSSPFAGAGNYLKYAGIGLLLYIGYTTIKKKAA